MSNRFHSKFHRQNHHTYSNETNPDAGHDPIASNDNPFRGDFILNGAITCNAPLSSYAGYFYSNNTALCAFAGFKGAHIYSTGNTGIYVYSAGISLSAHGLTQGANIYSPVKGLNVYGGSDAITCYSPNRGITSNGLTYAGSFYSNTRAITAFGNGYGIDVSSNFYGINSIGGTFGGNFYSISRGVSAFGGNVGVDVYSPKIGLNVKGLSSGLITNSPVLALSSTGGGVNVFDGNVGIATKSPNEKLTVSGNVSAKGLVYIDSNDNVYPALTITQAGTGHCIKINDQSGTDPSPFVVDKDGHLFMGALLAYDATNNFTAGFLGSGITSSSYMVTLSAQGTDSGLFIKSVSGVPFYIEDSDNETSPFIINHDGTVGIGTKTPNEKLTINGNLSANGNVYFDNGNFTGNVTIYGNLSTLGTITQTDTLLFVTSAVSITNTGTGPALTVKQTGTQDIATFLDDSNTSLIIKDGGNVGINTNTPNEKLTINGNISSNASINCNNLYVNNINGGDSSIEVGGTGNVYIDLKNPNSDDFDLRIATTGTTGSINTAVNYNLGIQSAASVGNVGIGTSAPNEKLTVSGSISSTGGFSASKPLSATGTYTVNSTDYSIILTAATTVTLPTPSESLGRLLYFKNISTGTITSASTNVVSINGAATNSILAAGPGKWVNLHCDGTYWQIMAGN